LEKKETLKIASKQKIQFKNGICAYVGSSYFAWNVIRLLKEITSYELFDNKLILIGDNGEIINFVKQ